MSQEHDDLQLDQSRISRGRIEGDDDISPLKYYGAILLVVLMCLGMVALFFV